MITKVATLKFNWLTKYHRSVHLQMCEVVKANWHKKIVVDRLVVHSVTRKKLPNVYKSCPKMISQQNWSISTPLQKLPMNVRDLGKINCCQRLYKVAQSPINQTIWSHWLCSKQQSMFEAHFMHFMISINRMKKNISNIPFMVLNFFTRHDIWRAVNWSTDSQAKA